MKSVNMSFPAMSYPTCAGCGMPSLLLHRRESDMRHCEGHTRGDCSLHCHSSATVSGLRQVGTFMQ